MPTGREAWPNADCASRDKGYSVQGGVAQRSPEFLDLAALVPADLLTNNARKVVNQNLKSSLYLQTAYVFLCMSCMSFVAAHCHARHADAA